MTANSPPVTTGPVLVGILPGTPATPTNLAAALQAGPAVRLTWRDNANNETGFLVDRCTGVGCANFAQIAVAPPRNGTGNTSYVDTTVTAGNDYSYRVFARNSVGTSADNTNIASVTVPAIPSAPTSFTVTAVKAGGNNYTATLTWAPATGTNLTNFTVQRATNSTFTAGLNTATYAPGSSPRTQTVNRNSTYYYRIRANNSISGSSLWTNALPFPLRTGP